MGFFSGGGLLGAILRGAAEQQNDRMRRDAAREWADSFSKPQSHSSNGWECKYCGMRFAGSRRPGVNSGGSCRNSPYGKHSWIEY